MSFRSSEVAPVAVGAADECGFGFTASLGSQDHTAFFSSETYLL